MDHQASAPRPPVPSAGCCDEEIDRAIAAAVANAALDGQLVEPDEQALGRRRLRGEISHPELLQLARQLAVTKANTQRDRHSDGQANKPDPDVTPGSEPDGPASQVAAEQSYLIGDTTVLRNVPDLTDQDTLDSYERLVVSVAEAALILDRHLGR